MDDGAIVLGNLAMKARRLSLTANSEARAARGQALFAGALGALVRAAQVGRNDLGQAQPQGTPAAPTALRRAPYPRANGIAWRSGQRSLGYLDAEEHAARARFAIWSGTAATAPGWRATKGH